MSWILFCGWISLCAGILATLAFVITFLLEQERRPAAVTGAVAVPLLGLFALLLLIDFPARPWIVLGILVLLAITYFATVGIRTDSTSLQVIGPQDRIDERDALFHRFYRIKPGSPEFETYYERYPEKKNFDDRVRRLPHLAAPGSKVYHQLASPFQIACFQMIEDISRDLDCPPAPMEGKPISAAPEEHTRRIKGFARYLGARSVGCTTLNQAYVYSNIGRSPGTWGAPIEVNHSHAIAVAVEMSHEMVRHSPDSPTTTETAFKYLEVGKIAMVLARYINLLGYEARAHVDGNYRVMCVPIAADAGLGELGRIGLLVTPEFGPRVRLAVVTTDLPLDQDEPVTFGVQDFCESCMKCADICPSGSIDAGKKAIHAGVEKWQSRMDSCYRHWRTAGSDCCLCVKVCPYSHPANPLHNFIRWVIGHNPLARRLALWGDDLAYGRRPGGTYSFPDWHDKK